MVEKLKKFDVAMCNCFLGEHMETIEKSDGEFFKVEDVEPILNSLQQLKECHSLLCLASQLLELHCPNHALVSRIDKFLATASV